MFSIFAFFMCWEPITTSASLILSNNLGISLGENDKSASSVIIMSPFAFENPSLNALPGPLLGSYVTMARFLYNFFASFKADNVPSLLPSLTTIISYFWFNFDKTEFTFSNVFFTLSSSLYIGIIKDIICMQKF